MTASPPEVIVAGAFEDIRSRHLRLLQEAARLGPLTVLLWQGDPLESAGAKLPSLSFEERLYFLRAVRYVNRVVPAGDWLAADRLPAIPGMHPKVWVDTFHASNAARQAWCREQAIQYTVLQPERLAGFPQIASAPGAPGRRKVVVTGCYDWLHSGHIRFFEEVSAYGDVYAIVGHDANIRLLKGPGHPLLPQQERRYLIGSIRFVTQALVSTGEGWLDADPEIQRLKPDVYAVNEDGDKGGKRDYCARRGIEYLVLKRAPAPGLPRRSSTELRGF
jgi:cytidyltransferase-like protein